ncbi:MAG: hypothetical protein JWO54_156 [Candidatus Saccharibacteria bacterium]|nr:hypothetical protein [Candidatus Saccharibacteria bacterium]MDB5180398.1 hypothetical protein [Candidatus Saccharibacteria bacterium]
MNVTTKKTLTGIFAAFVFALVALFSPVAPTASAADCGTASEGIQAGINCAEGKDVPGTLFGGSDSIFTTIVNVLLFLIGAISVIMLIYGGIRYTTSGGNSANVTAAKNTIMYAIIGLIVAFLAFAVVNWVLSAITTNV